MTHRIENGAPQQPDPPIAGLDVGPTFTVGPALTATADDPLGRSGGNHHGADTRPWRVFISHTQELTDHPRSGSFVAAAKLAVERAGHAVVEMDSWTASDHPPAALCAEKVRGCDVYVGLLGFHYGSPVRDDPSHSYTELEFETATTLGMPRLIFVLSEQLDMPALPASFYIDACYTDRQWAFRAGIDGSGVTRAEIENPLHLETLLYQALVELQLRIQQTERVLALEASPATAAPMRSTYLAQVSDIAPPTLFDREHELAELAAFCSGGEPYVWWQAGPWAGKSALMSTFALHPPPGVDVLCFFITARLAGQSDSTAFAEAMTEQLAAVLRETPPPSMSPAMRDSVRRDMLARAGTAAQAQNRSILLLIDGVDEDRGPAAGLPSILRLLPKNPLPSVRIVLAGRTHPPVPTDVDGDHPARSCRVRSLTPSPHAQAMADSAREELRDLIAQPGGTRDVIGLLTTAGGGLTIDDLHALTEQPPASLRQLLEQVAGRTLRTRPHPELVGRGDRANAGDGYLLGHETLQVEAITELGSHLLSEYRNRLIAWAEEYRGRGWPAGTPRYLLVGYCGMLRAGNDLPRLLACATDRARHERLRIDTGGDAQAISEIGAAQSVAMTAAPDEQPDLMALCLLAIHRRELADRNSNVPEPLPAIWALLGQPARARALADSIADPFLATTALTKVAQSSARAGDPGVALEAAEQARTMAGRITDPYRATLALIEVARALAGAGAPDRAEAVAEQVSDPLGQAQAFTEIARALAEAGELRGARAGAERAGLVAGTLADLSSHTMALTEVARALAEAGAAERAREVVAGFHDRYPQAQALTEIARALCEAGDHRQAQATAEQAEKVINKITTPSRQALALAGVSRVLTLTGAPDRAHSAAEYGSAVAANIQDPASRARARTEVTRALAEAGAIDRAQSVAAEIPDQYLHVRALTAIGCALAQAGERDRPRSLAGQAREVALSISDPARQSLALAEVTRALAMIGEWNQAQSVAAGISDPPGRAQAVASVARALAQAADPERATELATSLADPPGRAQALTEVARALAEAGDPHQAQAVAQLAQGVAAAIPDSFPQAQALTEVAHCLAESGELDQALAVARRARAVANTIADRSGRAQALAAVAWSLARAGAQAQAQSAAEQAAEVATTIADPSSHAVTLATLARTLAAAGERPWARATAKRARLVATDIPDRFRKEPALVEVTQALARAGDLDLARTTAEQIVSPASQALALAALAEALTEAGEQNESRTVAGQAQKVAASIVDPIRAAVALVDVARALAHAGDRDQALAVADRIAHSFHQALALAAVARALNAAGDHDQAVAVVQRAQACAEQVADPASQSQALTTVAAVLAEVGLSGPARRALAAAWMLGPDWWIQLRTLTGFDQEAGRAISQAVAGR